MIPLGRGRASLRREIVVWYSVVLLVALSAFTVITYALLQRTLDRTGSAALREAVLFVEDQQVPRGMPRIVVGERESRVTMPNGEELDVLLRRIRLADGREIPIVAARSNEMEEFALSSFRFIALLVIPLTALLAALGGWALIDRLLTPLARLVDTTRRIGIGDLSRRVDEPERPAELTDLARSFNGMLTRLERAVQALRRFTADASHELRTPLTSIKGTVQVALVRERTAEELAATLEEVLEETEWMLQLVEGLLTLAQGEEGGIQIESTPVDLSSLLEDVGEVGLALAQGKSVTVESRVPPGLRVRGSAGGLRQVFLNLISNAVKFTASGTVTLTAVRLGGERRRPMAAEGAEGPPADTTRWIEVRVQDTGIGISAEELPRVFDRFYRGDAARARPGGTGLGLAIASLLVELHGGTMEASSQPGEGSEFRVRLPEDVAPGAVGPESGGSMQPAPSKSF